MEGSLCHIHVSRAQQVEKSERASDCDIKHYEMHISVHVKAWFGDDVGKRQIVPSRAEAKKKALLLSAITSPRIWFLSTHSAKRELSAYLHNPCSNYEANTRVVDSRYSIEDIPTKLVTHAACMRHIAGSVSCLIVLLQVSLWRVAGTVDWHQGNWSGELFFERRSIFNIWCHWCDHKHHIPREILYAPSGLPCNHQTDIRGAHSLSLVACLVAMTLTGNRGCCASRSKNALCASFAVHASHLMPSEPWQSNHRSSESGIIFRSIGMTWYRDAF